MKTKKGDFVEIEFVASTEDGIIFDTNIKEEAKKIDIDDKEREKLEPLKVCIGQGMILKGLDKELEDKELEKEYDVKLNSESAFGKRNPGLVKTVPLAAFSETPYQGMFINVNGLMARVVSVNGGRILVDFNNPLAGKNVNYKFKILKMIEGKDDKIKVIAESLKVEIENIDLAKEPVEIKLKNKKNSEKFIKRIKELVSLDCKIV